MTLGRYSLSNFCSRGTPPREVYRAMKVPLEVLVEALEDEHDPGGPARHERLFATPEREFFIDNLLVRINSIIVMIRWTGPARTPVCHAI